MVASSPKPFVKAKPVESPEPKLELQANVVTTPDDNPISSEGWKRFVSRVKDAGPALAAVLQHGRLVQFGPMGVKIGYAKESFYWTSANDRDNKKIILQKLQEHFGQAVTFSTVAAEEMGEDRPATLAELHEQEKSDETTQIREDAIAHPAVQGAIALMGGEVENVTPLGGNS
jgi:hypothetical protein